jgi:hypothetical protein
MEVVAFVCLLVEAIQLSFIQMVRFATKSLFLGI